MKRYRLVLATLLATLASSATFAQDFLDLGRIPGVPNEPNVEVQLNAALLAFVAAAAKAEEPDVAAAISGLEALRVRVYKEVQDAAAVATFVDSASRRLESGGWQRTVYVQGSAEKVRIYTRMAGERMTGMTVMVLDSSEAVFIDIVGSIDPAQLGRVASAVGAGDVLSGVSGGGRRSEATGAAAPETAANADANR